MGAITSSYKEKNIMVWFLTYGRIVMLLNSLQQCCIMLEEANPIDR